MGIIYWKLLRNFISAETSWEVLYICFEWLQHFLITENKQTKKPLNIIKSILMVYIAFTVFTVPTYKQVLEHLFTWYWPSHNTACGLAYSMKVATFPYLSVFCITLMKQKLYWERHSGRNGKQVMGRYFKGCCLGKMAVLQWLPRLPLLNGATVIGSCAFLDNHNCKTRLN